MKDITDFKKALKIGSKWELWQTNDQGDIYLKRRLEITGIRIKLSFGEFVECIDLEDGYLHGIGFDNHQRCVFTENVAYIYTVRTQDMPKILLYMLRKISD